MNFKKSKYLRNTKDITMIEKYYLRNYKPEEINMLNSRDVDDSTTINELFFELEKARELI